MKNLNVDLFVHVDVLRSSCHANIFSNKESVWNEYHMKFLDWTQNASTFFMHSFWHEGVNLKDLTSITRGGIEGTVEGTHSGILTISSK